MPLLERYAFFRDFDMSQVFAIPPTRNLWYRAEATGPGVMVDGNAIQANLQAVVEKYVTYGIGAGGKVVWLGVPGTSHAR